MHPALEHLPRLRRYAAALTRDAIRAEDLVQDTLERAYRKWHLWQTDTNLRAWLFSIMHNVYVNQAVRETSTPSMMSLDEAAHETSRPFQETQPSKQDLMSALSKLPSDQREVILLTCLEDMKYEEVAYVMQVPIGTVRSRLARGRERLRQLMEGTGNEAVSTPLKVVK